MLWWCYSGSRPLVAYKIKRQISHGRSCVTFLYIYHSLYINPFAADKHLCVIEDMNILSISFLQDFFSNSDASASKLLENLEKCDLWVNLLLHTFSAIQSFFSISYVHVRSINSGKPWRPGNGCWYFLKYTNNKKVQIMDA